MRHDRQVLICPDCQRTDPLLAQLDHCGDCASTDLICRLGEIECRACGAVRGATPAPEPEVTTVPAGATPAPTPAQADPTTLSTEVEQALARVLGHRRAR
ncbi:MAG TPA: hypothetical protein VGL93_02900 [Streptosporangiaceae bacterium]